MVGMVTSASPSNDPDTQPAPPVVADVLDLTDEEIREFAPKYMAALRTQSAKARKRKQAHESPRE
jgi:hypothetical protein